MHHKPMLKFVYRLAAAAIAFSFMTAIIWLIGFPSAWAWSAMLTLIFYKSILRKVM